MTATAESLIEVLLDRSALIAERDDAASDLGAFDCKEALVTLLAVAALPEEPEVVLWSCGESIAEIWRRNGTFDRGAFDALTGQAKQEIRELLPAATAYRE